MTKSWSVGLVSLGCAKNLVDSEHILSLLLGRGARLAPSPGRADVILVNTCAFIRDAKAESIEAILEACEGKAAGKCRAVVVCGCLPQRYRRQVRELLPEVDAFVGLDELEKIGPAIERLAKGLKTRDEITPTAARLYEPGGTRPLLTGGQFAYVKIAEGCNHRCAFCAIPAIRGRLRSRSEESILRECAGLLDGGARELNLISQDTTAYGRDLGAADGLAGLIAKIGGLGGAFWIRLLYAHPAGLTGALLDAIGTVRQACHYLDVPVQHSHPQILRAMHRGGSARAVQAMPGLVRRTLPDVSLRTTCLVGFPGEGEEHFEHLLEYVKRSEFDHLGAFVFSAEESTPAFNLPGGVHPRRAAGRMRRLMLAQFAVVGKKAAALIGREETLLVEARAGNRWVGRSFRSAPEADGKVIITGAPAATTAGDFLLARYTRADGYDMRAVCLRRL